MDEPREFYKSNKIRHLVHIESSTKVSNFPLPIIIIIVTIILIWESKAQSFLTFILLILNLQEQKLLETTSSLNC